MKKLLVVLLALGLLAGFSMTASAQTAVKFGGGYYIVGVYEDNRTFADTTLGTSRAFIWQRARIKPIFTIAEGLTFTLQMDALEKQWGNTNWRVDLEDKSNSRRANPPSQNAQENFEFEQAYVTFKTAVGTFAVGYNDADVWGTGFGDTPVSRPQLRYSQVFGPLEILAVYEKFFEADASNQLNGTVPYALKTDADWDTYSLGGLYKFPGGTAALRYKYHLSATTRTAAAPYKMKKHEIAPFIKATFGPVYVESEVIYYFGKAREYDSGVGDVDAAGWGGYIMAKANLGPAYVGGQLMYSTGNQGNTDATKDKTGPISSTNYNPALILAHDHLRTWTYGSNYGGTNGVTIDSGKQNMILYNVFAGFNPTPKINIEAALTFANAIEKPSATWQDKNYGTEFDVTASYKIYDNLTFKIGAGYLWTGDYFKGTNANGKVGNDYILLNRLDMSF